MATTTEAVMFSQSDARADGGVRHIRVGRSEILILRRFEGMNMRILTPVNMYRGVALSVETAADGAFVFRISLSHTDPELDILLCESQNPRSIAIEWAQWAEYLSLPRLSEDMGAVREVQEEQAAPRARRLTPSAKRRPRFLARRKSGDPARSTVVFAGEREIVCYE